ncbi:MAG: helix-turn-helix transcriptional regulator [Pseudomonadota bacterium]
MSLATRIRELRLQKGESLQELADAIGVSKTHVWEMEKGRSQNPSIEILSSLADHFKVTVADLAGENPSAAGGDAEVMRMFRQVGKLSDNDRAMLDDMIQVMLKRQRERDASD